MLQRFEHLNLSLQSLNAYVCGLVQAVEAQNEELIDISCEENFSTISKKASSAAESFDLAEIIARRIQRPSVRLTCQATVHQNTEE